MVFVRFQVLAFGHADAHIGAIRGIGQALGGEALVAAGLLNGGDYEGVQHAGSSLGGGQCQLHRPLSVMVQLSGKEGIFRRGEVAGRVVEAVLLETLEGGGPALSQRHLRPYGSSFGRAAGEPGSGGVHGNSHPTFQHRRVRSIDFEPIRLYCLYMHRFVESAAAHFEVGVPVAGGVIGLGGDAVAVEAVHALAGEAAVELSFRRVEFQRGGMPLGQRLAPVVEEERKMQHVSRPPYAAFAVHEALQAFLQHFAAHVVPAEGTLVSASHLQISHAAAGLGHHGKRLARYGNLCQALTVGLAGADAL